MSQGSNETTRSEIPAPASSGSKPDAVRLHASVPAEPGAQLSLTSHDAQPGEGGRAGKGSRAPAEATHQSRKPRRGRVTVEFAECSLGEILDVSPTGLRARYKGSSRNLPLVDERFDMQVRTPDGPVPVRARVAWIKRIGFRKHDVGVEFIATNEKEAVKLKQLASMAGRAMVINEATGGSKLRAG